MIHTLHQVSVNLSISSENQSFFSLLNTLSGALGYGQRNNQLGEERKIGIFSSIKDYLESQLQEKNKKHNIGGVHITSTKIYEGSLELFFEALIIGTANYEKIKSYVDDVAELLRRDFTSIYGVNASVTSKSTIRKEKIGNQQDKRPQQQEIRTISPPSQQEIKDQNVIERVISPEPITEKSNRKFTYLHLGILLIIILQAYSVLNNRTNAKSSESVNTNDNNNLVVREMIRDEIQKVRLNILLMRMDSLAAFR